jgi:hypothetical protein
MGLCTLATWKVYAKKTDGDATAQGVALEALYQVFLDSAEQIVREYLGYDPASQTYTSQAYWGNGSSSIVLKAKPITDLSSISINGVADSVGDWLIDGERLTEKSGAIYSKADAFLVTFTAGLAAGAALNLVILTCMDIASLLSQNMGDNIGVSSVSLDGGNSRTFINYNNFEKQLARLANLKLARLP